MTGISSKYMILSLAILELDIFRVKITHEKKAERKRAEEEKKTIVLERMKDAKT